MRQSRQTTRYRAAWLLLAVALAAFIAVWGVRIGASFHDVAQTEHTPVAVITAAPLVATAYSNIGPPNPSTLCAELSPEPAQVTVESTSGVVIATITCHK